MKRLIDLVVAFLIAAVVSIPTKAVDSISEARDLYAAAEYEGALALLNRLQPTAQEPEERRAIEQYRAYCLLALGRPADAEQAIAAVVEATPLYKPSGSEVSPRVRSAFSEVRRRMLPTIIQEKYAAAKAAFDGKNYKAAAAGFAEVVAAMADPDVADVVAKPPLSDLRTLAAGFRDLSVTAAAPPPLQAHAPTLSAPAPTAPAALPSAATAATRPSGVKIYSLSDPSVSAPVALKQSLPPFPLNLWPAKRGVLEVVVNELGEVETAAMREPINARYDHDVVEATRSWRFKPATLDGTPVKYRKMLQIDVKK